jgi:hypothetical protein
MDFHNIKQQKWSEIEEKALKHIRKNRGKFIIEYFYRPSFRICPTCVQIFSKLESYYCYKIVWREDIDKQRFIDLSGKSTIEDYLRRVNTKILENWLQPKINDFRLASFEPTIELTKYQIDETSYQNLYNKLDKLQLPIIASFESGLDGTDYVFSIKNTFCGSHEYCWWGNLPKEWKELQTIIDEIDKLVVS